MRRLLGRQGTHTYFFKKVFDMEKNEILQLLENFKKNSQKKYSILRIGIFGSAARDILKDQSDVDIVVELEKQNLFNIVGIKQDLEEKLRLPVDIVSYRRSMNPFLKSRIDKEAVYV